MYNDICNYSTKVSINEKDQLFILKTLFYMNSYQELSSWVSEVTHGKKFLVFPKYSNTIDREVCLSKIQNIIFLSLSNIHKRRKNGRDIKLLRAANNSDFFEVANILASSARTFWLDNGFLKNYNY